MGLVPPSWEPLDGEVEPFGPAELEIREYQESPSQSARKWRVRIAARPETVSTGRPADSPAFPCDLNEPDEIKRCVVRRLRALIPRNLDKETDSRPSNFQF